MKTLILSTLAAVALALSAGTALANNSNDNGFAIYLQSQGKAPASQASFLSGSSNVGDDHIFSNNGRDAREFRAVQGQGASASFLSGSVYVGDDHDFSNNARDAREFRATQEQGR